MEDYKGTIIEESLADKNVLKDVTILSTRVEPITERHQTPWLSQWTLHKVEVSAERAKEIAEVIRRSIDREHSAWYADFKTGTHHFIIFPEKIFFIDRKSAGEYESARQYGISLGIPEYQVQFSKHVVR